MEVENYDIIISWRGIRKREWKTKIDIMSVPWREQNIQGFLSPKGEGEGDHKFWISSGHSFITFAILLFPIQSTDNYTIAAEVPTYWTDHTIRGLQPQTAYEFIVESVRLSMFGGEVIEPPSAPVYVRTVCGGKDSIFFLHENLWMNGIDMLYLIP